MDIYLPLKLIILVILSMNIIGCNHVKPVGPNLVSEQVAVQIAVDEIGLRNIHFIELTTVGPVYRVVYGEDEFGNKIVVWIQNDVVYSEKLENGISRSEIINLALKKGFNEDDIVQLIYVPSEIKEKVHPYLKNSKSNVFWCIRTTDAEVSHQIFLDFYDGKIVFEK